MLKAFLVDADIELFTFKGISVYDNIISCGSIEPEEVPELIKCVEKIQSVSLVIRYYPYGFEDLDD